MYIYEDLPEPIKGLLEGEYFLLSVDFEKAEIRIRKRKDGYLQPMGKLIDPDFLGRLAEQIWRGNLTYKVSPSPKE